MDHPERPAAVEVHHPIPLTPAHPMPAPIVPAQHAPAVQSVVLPDGRVVTGYTLQPTTPPAPVPAAQAAVSRTALNIALGGIGFGAICGGLLLLTSFIAAIAALIQQLIILAAVIFGGFIAVQILGHRPGGSTTVNIGRAVFKRNHFHA
ncbi:hypothetical protein ACWFR5_44235 [Streptomyces sp. NPDC055092]